MHEGWGGGRRWVIAALLAVASCAQPAMAALAPKVAPAVAGGLILKDGSGLISSINVTSGATAGYVMVADSATIPADGAIVPIVCVPLAATTGILLNFRMDPMTVGTGAVVLFSSTGCYTLTKSATAYISGEVR